VDTADRESVGGPRTVHSFRGSYPVGPQGTSVPKRLESPDNLVAAAAVAACVAAVPSTKLRRHEVKHTVYRARMILMEYSQSLAQAESVGFIPFKTQQMNR